MSEQRVSVVIPVKNSASTIEKCVASILAQDYGDFQVIVVGDSDDSSWPALAHLKDPRLIRVPVKVSMNGATRDANLKRCIGLGIADGEVIALTDSDMEMRAGWLADGVRLTETYDVVASSMISSSSGFLGEYVDNNRVGSRTPRYGTPYQLNADNFGSRGHKPPVTANLFMRRAVLDETNGPNPSFTRSYEDYEWARRIVDSGFHIYCTDELAGYHSHRVHPRAIMRDYRRAGRGCADYIVTHPHCDLAKSRMVQAAGISLAVPVLLALVVVVPLIALIGGTALALAAMTLSAVRSRSLVAAIYPVVTLLLGLTFWLGLITQLFTNRPRLALRAATLPTPVGVHASPWLPRMRSAMDDDPTLAGTRRVGVA